MSKPLIGLSFKAVETKKRKATSTKPHKLSKLIYAVCVKDEKSGEYRANIIVVGNPHKTILNIPFSLDSYNLKGKEKVFSIKLDKQTKKHICYIRTAREAILSGEKSRTVTPFCEDWVYSGYLVRIGKLNYFQIKEAIWHKDFVKENLEVPAEEIKL